MLVQNVLLVGFLVTVMYTDWRYQRIPNVVTYPMMVVGLGLSALQGLGGLGSGGLIDHLLAVVLAFLACYPLLVLGGIKAGDAKLLMAVGALRGGWFLLSAAFYGAIIGGLVALCVIAVRMTARPAAGAPPNTLGRVMKSWFPYGVSLAAGGLVALIVETTRG